MTRMIRGKVIVNHPGDEGELIEASLSSLDGFADAFAAEETQMASFEGAVEENPMRDGATFAPPSAPWVGAESAWRQGIVPPPHVDWQRYKIRLDDRDLFPGEDLTLTDDEVAMVLSSIPPHAPPEIPKRRTFNFGQIARYAAVALVTATAAAVIFGVTGSSKDAPVPQSQMTSAETAGIVPSAMPTTTPSDPTGVSEEFSAASAPKTETPKSTPKATSVDSAVGFSSEPQVAQMIFDVPQPAHTTKSASSKTAAKTARSADKTETDLEKAGSDETASAAFALVNPYQPVAENKEATAENTGESKKISSLSRDDVVSAMDSIASRVIACGNGRETGRIVMRVRVSGATGNVVHAAAAYAPYVDTPIGACAARAVKRAQFPKFSESEMTIKYPFEF